MSTKKQHYVPKVYLEAWETTVETKNEPKKKFTGVYQFVRGESIGNGCNKKTVLWKPHLYTISFKQLYLAQKCPKVYGCFVNKIYEEMIHNTPQPVYGVYNHSVIKSKKSVRDHLVAINDWDFYYYDESPAKKRNLINKFNNINCYLLEESFSDIFESRWKTIKNTFINEVKESVKLNEYGERIISFKTTTDMLEFFFMMYCRSPRFDPFNLYAFFGNTLKEIFDDFRQEYNKDNNDLILIHKEIEEMKQSLWYSDLYKMFFKTSGGFFNTVLSSVIKNCRIFLYEAQQSAGTFITSDNPAFLHKLLVETSNSNGLYFSIDPTHLLFIAKGDGEINRVLFRTANNCTIRKFNKIIASHKVNTIIADNKELGKMT